MASNLEENISRSLRAVLAEKPSGANLADSERLRDVVDGLEFFLPKVLAEAHSEWQRESLDGVLPLLARKTGEGQAEILGHCILIADQTLVPFHLQLRLAPTADEIAWLDCRLGELRDGKMIRTPYGSQNFKQLFRPTDSKIAWAYHVAFGER